MNLSDEAIAAAVRSLEAVLADYAHLAPEFAMIAAQQWAESYKPGRVVRLYVQYSEVAKFLNGETDMLVMRRSEHFPFVDSVEVALK